MAAGEPGADGQSSVPQPTELRAYDLIRIGKTTLRFIPLAAPISRGAARSRIRSRVD
jgi:hypothetical protein